MEISKKAQQMAEENSLSEEVNQAYIDNVGEEYATADHAEEAYQGQYTSDEEFAQETFDQTKTMNDDQLSSWPYTCIDWEWASRELMMDYFEVDGYYFRSL